MATLFYENSRLSKFV